LTTIERMLIAMTLILGLPYLIWRLGRTEYFAPLVVVQILAGIALGPGLLGAVFPAYYQAVFTPEVIAQLGAIAAWAVMLFVWTAGLELDLHEAWDKRGETLLTAGLALGVPLAFGGAAAALMLAQDAAWAGPEARSWQFVLGVGMACAVTALPILILFMEKLAILREPLGQRVLRYASLDDVVIWGVLALILLDYERLGRQAVFLSGFALAAWGMAKMMPKLPERDRWYVSMVWLAACGFAGDWSGLHYMVGAFLAGAVMDRRWFNPEHLDLLRSHLLLVVMPVFFLSTGLRTQWTLGGAAVFGAAALLLVASVSGKLAGVHLAGKLLRWPKGEAAVIGWLLQTKALIMIIFANILLDRGVIAAGTFTALLLMAVASTMFTVPMVAPRLRRSA
jgi:Kef-type K+ transport system membrane component KefB